MVGVMVSHILQAKAERDRRDEEIGRAQMMAAVSKGIGWGMDDDALEGSHTESQTPAVDWRTYCQSHSLTSKQQKLADRLRRLEGKIQNLSAEAEKIRVRVLGAFCSVQWIFFHLHSRCL